MNVDYERDADKYWFVSMAEAARTLGVSPATVKRMIEREEIPHVEGLGVPVDEVNWHRKRRIHLAYAEYERLVAIPPLG